MQDPLSFSQMNVNVMQRAGNPVTDSILTASIFHLDGSLLLLVHSLFFHLSMKQLRLCQKKHIVL